MAEQAATRRDVVCMHRATPGRSGPELPVLTRRQQEILLHCVESGYYEIPRRVTLRSMAKRLGISATSLSLVLRRAERTIVRQHAERLAARLGGTDTVVTAARGVTRRNPRRRR